MWQERITQRYDRYDRFIQVCFLGCPLAYRVTWWSVERPISHATHRPPTIRPPFPAALCTHTRWAVVAVSAVLHFPTIPTTTTTLCPASSRNGTRIKVCMPANPSKNCCSLYLSNFANVNIITKLKTVQNCIWKDGNVLLTMLSLTSKFKSWVCVCVCVCVCVWVWVWKRERILCNINHVWD